MMNATWRRLGSPAWLASGLVLLLPTLAQAQLFPNRTIRRERPPCSSEPPFNATVRRDYFGYYPTCWSRFPAGWECPCPNPEKPNAALEFQRMPLGSQRGNGPRVDSGAGLDDTAPDDMGDRKPANPAGDNAIPLPNGGRSPFELDPNPKPPGTPGADPTPPPSGPGSRPSAGLMEMPKLPATTPSASFESPLQPGAMAMTPDASLASNNTSEARPDLGPLPSAPVSIPNNLANPSDPIYQPTQTAPAPAPVQAPKRRGILSSLFGPKNTQNR
jgi:hypothetical protein